MIEFCRYLCIDNPSLSTTYFTHFVSIWILILNPACITKIICWKMFTNHFFAVKLASVVLVSCINKLGFFSLIIWFILASLSSVFNTLSRKFSYFRATFSFKLSSLSWPKSKLITCTFLYSEQCQIVNLHFPSEYTNNVAFTLPLLSSILFNDFINTVGNYWKSKPSFCSSRIIPNMFSSVSITPEKKGSPSESISILTREMFGL